MQPFPPFPPESILVGRTYAMRLRIHDDQSLSNSASAFDWMIAVVNNPTPTPMRYKEFMKVVQTFNRLGCRSPLIQGPDMNDQATSTFAEALSVIDIITNGGGGEAFRTLTPLQTSPKFPVYIYRERPLTFEQFLVLANQLGRMGSEEGMMFLNSCTQPSQPIHLYDFPQSAIFQSSDGTSKPSDLNLFFPPHTDGSSKILQENKHFLPPPSKASELEHISTLKNSPPSINSSSQDMDGQIKLQHSSNSAPTIEQKVIPNMSLEQGDVIYHESVHETPPDDQNPPGEFFERTQEENAQHEEMFAEGENILKDAETEPFNAHNFLALHSTACGPEIDNLVEEYELEELQEKMKNKGNIDPSMQKAIMLVSKQNNHIAEKQAEIFQLHSQVEEQAKVISTLSEFKTQFSSDLKSMNGSLHNLVGRLDQMAGITQAVVNLRTEVSESSLTLSKFVDQVKKENRESHDSMLAMFLQYQSGRDSQMVTVNPSTPSPSPHRFKKSSTQSTPIPINSRPNQNAPTPVLSKNPTRNDTNLTKVQIEGRNTTSSKPQSQVPKLPSPQVTLAQHPPTNGSPHLFTQRMGKVDQRMNSQQVTHTEASQANPIHMTPAQQYQPTMVYNQGEGSRQFPQASSFNSQTSGFSQVPAVPQPGAEDFKRPLPQSPHTPQGVRHPRKRLVFNESNPPHLPVPTNSYQSSTNYNQQAQSFQRASPPIPPPNTSQQHQSLQRPGLTHNFTQNKQFHQKSDPPSPRNNPNFAAQDVRRNHNPTQNPQTDHQRQSTQESVRVLNMHHSLNFPPPTAHQNQTPPNAHQYQNHPALNGEGTVNSNADYFY